MAEREFAIRLSAKGMDQTRAALKGMGAEGAAALRQIDAANRQVTPGLKAVDTAAAGVRSRFDQLAGSVPVIGGALQAMGPQGLAAGVGISAITLAFNALWGAGNKAIETLDNINTAAADAGLSAESFQALQLTGIESDVENLSASMMTLEKNTAEAAAGSGKLYGKLKDLHPEILQQLVAAKTQEERWDAVAAAIRNTTDRTEQVQLATAAFGKQGAQLIRVLEQQNGTIEGLTNRYREMGLILEEDVIKAADEADRQLDLMHKKMEVEWTNAMVGFTPVIVGLTGALADAAGAGGAFLDSMNAIEERSFSTLTRNIDDLKKKLDELTSGETQGALNRALFGDIRETGEVPAQAIRVQIAALNDELQKRKREYYKGPEGSGEGVDPAEEAREKAATEAAKKAAEEARAAAAIERQAIALRKELGDWTGVYAAKVAELTPLVGQYGVTQEMVNAALAAFQAELDGSAASADKTAAALAGLESPAQKATKALADYVAEAVRLGVSTLPETILAIRVMTEEVNRLHDAEDRTSNRASALADSIGTAVTATKGMRKSSLELNLALETTDAIYRGQMNTLRDLEDVALDVFYNMAISAIYAQSQIKGSGLLDFLSAAASPILGAFGISGAPAGGASGGGNASTGGGSVVTRRMHTGGVVGSAAIGFPVPSSIFVGAPRHHTGMEPRLGPGERAIIAEDGERMFSRMDNARIVRAIENGGSGAAPKLELHLHGVEQQPEVKQTPQADGSLRIDVMLEKKVIEVLGSSKSHKAMRNNYGLLPASRS